MKNLFKLLATICFIAVMLSTFGQGMYYQNYGLTSTIRPQNGVKLSNGDYVFCGYDSNNNNAPTIYSTAGWSIPVIPEPGGTEYLPMVTSSNDTIYSVFTHDDAITIGDTTYPDPPYGAIRPIALMINTDGVILNSWEIDGFSRAWGISAKSGEFAVMGRAYNWPIEHLFYPSLPWGGAYVLINDLTDWDVNKGFALETEYIPSMHSIQYLQNGNLALAGESSGGDINFGGIILPVDGSDYDDGFRGEITTTGIGINAVLIDSYRNTEDNYQIAMSDGSYIITGRYRYSVSFYQSDGTLDLTLNTGNSIDQIYFATYDSNGNFITASCAYNHINEGLKNRDLACNDSSFYSIIDNSEGGTVVTPTGSHDKEAAVFLKFNKDGTPVWSKQYDGPYPSEYAYYIIDEDTVTIFGSEAPTTDIDFNSGEVYLPDYSGFWANYYDGTTSNPTANFIGTPTTLVAGQSVTYTDVSTQGTNPISSWTWTFEGGTPGTYSGQTPPAIVYNTSGTYDVTLVVSDGSLSDTEVKADYITVNSATPPTVDFSADPTSGTAPQSVSFTDLSVAGSNPITSWDWDFGDGGSSSAQNPWHTYNSPGTYTVSLTVSDGNLSNTETKTDYIVISEPAPIADFIADVTVVEEGGSVNFTDLSTGNPTSWSWTFEGGDPATSTAQNPTVTYDIEGAYDVSLTVTNSVGSDAETKVDYITVTNTPYLDISPTSATVSASSGNTSFNISSNESWTIETSDPEVTAAPSSGSGNASINVSYPAINTMAGETYTVTVTSNSNIVEVFTINQNGVNDYVTLTPDNATVSASAGSTTFTVNCPDDASWDVTGLSPWVSATPLSGIGSGTVQLDYLENTDPNSRFDDISVSTNTAMAVFTLTQVGAGAPLEAYASASVEVITAGNAFQLFGSATGGTGNYTYEWTGSEGFISTEQNPMVTPSLDGAHTYTLIVNDGSNTDTDVVEVDVFYVSFSIEVNPLSGTTSTEFSFYSEIVQDPNDPRTVVYHAIEFGDGEYYESSGNVVETTHTYASTGQYDIEKVYELSDGSSADTTWIALIDITTSVGDNPVEGNNNINIYPNPTSSVVFIDAQERPEMVSIVNISGSEVFHQENLGEMTQIDLGSLPSGMYFVRILSDGILTTHKVVKR